MRQARSRMHPNAGVMWTYTVGSRLDQRPENPLLIQRQDRRCPADGSHAPRHRYAKIVPFPVPANAKERGVWAVGMKT